MRPATTSFHPAGTAERGRCQPPQLQPSDGVLPCDKRYRRGSRRPRKIVCRVELGPRLHHICRQSCRYRETTRALNDVLLIHGALPCSVRLQLLSDRRLGPGMQRGDLRVAVCGTLAHSPHPQYSQPPASLTACLPSRRWSLQSSQTAGRHGKLAYVNPHSSLDR